MTPPSNQHVLKTPPLSLWRGCCPLAILAWYVLTTFNCSAQLEVTLGPLKVLGHKAVLPLNLKNSFAEKIDSARAVVFLLDEQGKMIGQSTQWVIGGTKDHSSLAVNATNTFHFVISSAHPFATTNLTAKVSFSRLVLEGGQLADPSKDVKISP